jgi:hypothetical protein
MKILLIRPARAPLTAGGEDIHLYEPLAREPLAAGVAADRSPSIDLIVRSGGMGQ